MFLDARARARASGDRGIAAACTADLERIGYREPEPGREVPPAGIHAERVETPTGMQTTAVRAPERAVPQVKPSPRESRRKGGRPPLPRCTHGQVVGRCGKCKTATGG